MCWKNEPGDNRKGRGIVNKLKVERRKETRRLIEYSESGKRL